MSTIINIKLSRMKNEIHVQFHENINSLAEIAAKLVDESGETKKIPFGIKSLYKLYNEAFKNELASLSVIVRSEITQKISEQDQIRDEVFRGFSQTVKAYRNHFDAKMRVAANLLWKVFLHYGDISRKSLDAQTAAVNDILREFERKDLSEAIKTLQLSEWKNKLKEENDIFHTLMIERYTETIGGTTLRMKNTRTETDKYYRALITEIENYALIGINTPEFNKFIVDINSVVKRFKDILAQEFGRKNAKAAKNIIPISINEDNNNNDDNKNTSSGNNILIKDNVININSNKHKHDGGSPDQIIDIPAK